VDLAQAREGKALEFKRDLSGPDGALKIIAAFANTPGGTVLLGVEDRTGHVGGVVPDRPGARRGRPAFDIDVLTCPRCGGRYS
jgi:hypothetical protein